MQVIASNFRPFAKNTLVGFVDLEVVDLGLRLLGWTVHKKDDARWIGPPGRKYVDDNGVEQWANTAEFTDKGKRAEFQKAAVEAIRRLLIPSKPATPRATAPAARSASPPPPPPPTRPAAPAPAELNDEIPF